MRTVEGIASRLGEGDKDDDEQKDRFICDAKKGGISNVGPKQGGRPQYKGLYRLLIIAFFVVLDLLE